MAKSRVSLKLLIDTQAKRVLFAEASKECVDFLFHLLSLPMATIVSLLKNQGMIGSMINLYKSIENLNESYMLLGRTKDSLLKPALLSQPHDPSVPLLLLEDSKSEKKFYRCSPCSRYECISDDPEAVCPYCFSKMTTCLRFVAGPWKQKGSTEGGFVKGLVTYMVMDNLVVEPMSTISCIIMLNKFNIKDLTSLEEKVVDMGMDEAILLLKASLQSDKVLTDVFLKVHYFLSFILLKNEGHHSHMVNRVHFVVAAQITMDAEGFNQAGDSKPMTKYSGQTDQVDCRVCWTEKKASSSCWPFLTNAVSVMQWSEWKCIGLSHFHWWMSLWLN